MKLMKMRKREPSWSGFAWRTSLAFLFIACGCGSDTARPTRKQGSAAQGPTDNTCASAWIDAVARRALMLSALARTPDRETAAQAYFLEDCRALPESVQRCLVKSYAAQHPERCEPGKALVELHEVFRRRCPGYPTTEGCLRADCAWVTSEQRCVAP